ncbi:hypothetical protein VFPPC_15993 [Pochonia chlamydosporia 170]|uniref:Uncharacterized protein n=1 Tax=Pochonia chlamydosporia 170 TaxID=1380566 RepID=A0A179FLK5_METCM|nr:hypothetical protein VFPPC_15993 [Pochonia chlamydosporia 170]OAQ66197.1 hypothetical protein VFPPC_15993 [Pochonia chlamydosporia 170]
MYLVEMHSKAATKDSRTNDCSTTSPRCLTFVGSCIFWHPSSAITLMACAIRAGIIQQGSAEQQIFIGGKVKCAQRRKPRGVPEERSLGHFSKERLTALEAPCPLPTHGVSGDYWAPFSLLRMLLVPQAAIDIILEESFGHFSKERFTTSETPCSTPTRCVW